MAVKGFTAIRSVLYAVNRIAADNWKKFTGAGSSFLNLSNPVSLSRRLSEKGCNLPPGIKGNSAMHKVTAGLFLFFDGVVQDTFKFQFESFDNQFGEMLTGVQDRVYTVLIGRVGRSEWVGYWPKAEQDMDLPPSSMAYRNTWPPTR
jgi:hypothetical protein